MRTGVMRGENKSEVMWRLLQGDALTALRSLESESAQTCVTSPPYWGLRDYGTGTWQGGDSECDHAMAQGQRQDTERGNHNGGKPGFHGGATSELSKRYFRGACGKCGAVRTDNQIGLEKTPEEYVARLVEIFREVKRVLRDDGTLWLNLGDSYFGDSPARKASSEAFSKQWNPADSAGNGGGRRSAARVGALKPKDLCMIPARVALALQSDGWYLRSDIIWAKPNPMPESVRDRPTKAHEYIFLLSKGAKYYYDADAIKEPISASSIARISQPNFANQTGGPKDYRNGVRPHRSMRRTVENFAKSLATPRNDGERWNENNGRGFIHGNGRNRRSVWTVTTKPYKDAHFATFPPDLIEPCILAGASEGGMVLDPFCGSGTTGAVAIKYGRQFIGIELNPAYIDMAGRRIADAESQQPPLNFVKTDESQNLEAGYRKNETPDLYKSEAVA